MVRSCQLRQFIIDLVDELSPLIGDDDIGAAKPAVIINSEILLSLKVIYSPADKLKNEMGQPLMQDCSGLVKLYSHSPSGTYHMCARTPLSPLPFLVPSRTWNRSSQGCYLTPSDHLQICQYCNSANSAVRTNC